MQRSLTMLFALVAYAIFFATFLYLIAFVGNIAVVPRTVDSGPAAAPATAAAIDIGLIALFGLQHSVMARQGFKAWWTRVVPPPAERSVYVLMASAALLILMSFWRPIEGTIWSVTNPLGETLLWALFALGWGIVLLSTFLLNHFELFGLQQAWFHMRGREAAAAGAAPAPVLQMGGAPALFRLLPRLLGNAADEHRAFAAGGRGVDLHADRHPLRGARPHRLSMARTIHATARASACSSRALANRRARSRA